MNFIEHFHKVLSDHSERALVTEVHDAELRPVKAAEIRHSPSARGSLRSAGVDAGDRVVLLAPNSAKWVASDLAILFEGAIVSPCTPDRRLTVARGHDARLLGKARCLRHRSAR